MRGFVDAPKALFSSRRTPAVTASRSSARERRSSAKTDQVRRRQAVELDPVRVLVVDLRLLVVGADGDPVRAGDVREDDAAARATGLRLGEGEAPRVVGVGVRRGVGRPGAGRLERRLRSEEERERDGDERRVGRRRAERRGRCAREGNAGARRVAADGDARLHVRRELDVERGGELGPLEELVREVATDRPAAEAGGDADRAACEARRSRPPRGPRRSRGRSGPAPRTRRRPARRVTTWTTPPSASEP